MGRPADGAGISIVASTKRLEGAWPLFDRIFFGRVRDLMPDKSMKVGKRNDEGSISTRSSLRFAATEQ